MIHVVLDTNVYYDNPSRDNSNFKAIEKLAIDNMLTLHMPYVIEREFQTQQTEQCKKDLNQTIKGLCNLSKRTLSINTLEIVEKAKYILEQNKPTIIDNAEKEIIKWLNSIGAHRIPLCQEQTINAMEAYFKGEPPLKSIKNRKDIPDSFIVHAINKLVKIHKQLHVVAKDEQVRNSFDENNSISTYESLPKFIGSKIIQNLLKASDSLSNLTEIGKSIKQFEEQHNTISDYISNNLNDSLIGHSIYDETFLCDQDITILSCENHASTNLDLDEVSYYGSGHFGIPFYTKTSVNATYFVAKSLFFSEQSSKTAKIISNYDNHCFEVEDSFDILAEGLVTFTIDLTKFDLDNFKNCFNIKSIKIDTIDKIVFTTL